VPSFWTVRILNTAASRWRCKSRLRSPGYQTYGRNSAATTVVVLATDNVSSLVKQTSGMYPPQILTRCEFEYVADTSFRPDEQLPFNKHLLKLEGRSHGDKKQGTTFTSIWVKASYTKAVLSIVFSYKKDEAPSRANQWYLETNEWYLNHPNRRILIPG
jgi:hypothetical protein